MRNENKAKYLISGFLFVISFSHKGCSQCVNSTKKAPDLFVISSINTYTNTVNLDSQKRLVLLQRFINSIIIDLKYSTSDNFTHRVLYAHPEAYVRLPVAVALKKVQEDLLKKGVGLKVYDGYRPYAVTKEMWKVVPDERYAANPAKGSGHNRGIAVDVTLVNIYTGKELEMPTGFDDFSEKAHQNFMNLPENVLQNRALLKTTMEKYGFTPLSTEWWHYSLSTATNYELLDLSFSDLEKLEKR